MFNYNLAYRHNNGDIEGFKGIGFTEESAKRDARNQIVRKVTMAQKPEDRFVYDKQIIESNKGLTAEEVKLVKNHWKSTLRY